MPEKDASPLSIPLIDFTSFSDPSSSVESQISVAKDVLEAFKSNGFVYLSNVVVSKEMVAEAFQWSEKFFQLPLEIKKEALHPYDGSYHRGFSPIGFEKIRPLKNSGKIEAQDQISLASDHKETLDIGNSKNELLCNIWLPEETEKKYQLNGIRFFFENFYQSCEKLKMQILRAISIGLMGIEKQDYLGKFHQDSNNQIRLAYYPAIEDNQLIQGVRERFASHTDFGSITILFQDQVGGLQVENPGKPGEFLDVKPIDNTVVVNVGDLLMRWSNDTLRSTLHRVGRPNATGILPPRYSIPYFCGPDPKALIQSLPGYESESKYEPVYADDYIKMRMQASY